MQEYSRRALVLVSIVVAMIPLVLQNVNLADVCTSMQPENPAPSCVQPYTRCEDYGQAGCPLTASCSGTTGVYPEDVPKNCEPGLADKICKNSTADTLCASTYSCIWVNGPGCVTQDFCSASNSSYKVSPSCTSGT